MDRVENAKAREHLFNDKIDGELRLSALNAFCSNKLLSDDDLILLVHDKRKSMRHHVIEWLPQLVSLNSNTDKYL